jgi:hypothetical protein
MLIVKVLSVTIAVASLAGCAVAHKTVMPDGRAGISINCSGAAMSWNYCYEKAGDRCPHGYDIISKDGEGGNGMAGGSGSGFFGSAGNTRSLMVSCKT